MFGEERKSVILSLIEQQTRVDVQELCEKFKVSESTVRRDLREMEEAGTIKRTHGGAISVKTVNFEPSFMEKEISRQAEKKAIARKALQWIREGDTVLLDAGTTTFYLLKELTAFAKLTVVTNSLILPTDMNIHPGIDIMMLGGMVRPGILSLVGPFAEKCLDLINVDKAFIATNGIDLKEGLTTPNLLEADIKHKMIQRADQVFLLSDSSKFKQVSFTKFADLQEIDICITDVGITKDYIEGLAEIGIEVYTVDPKEGNIL